MTDKRTKAELIKELAGFAVVHELAISFAKTQQKEIADLKQEAEETNQEMDALKGSLYGAERRAERSEENRLAMRLKFRAVRATIQAYLSVLKVELRQVGTETGFNNPIYEEASPEVKALEHLKQLAN